MKTRILGLLISALAIAAGLVASNVTVDAATPELRPMIFVHGRAGSGAQFESQAMRFATNGYPAGYIYVHEYDSSLTINTMDDVWAGLDQLIARVQAETGAEKVDILGHSMGTTVMHGWLTSSPERAAKVAHYVNIDGRTSTTPPGGVPTLAIWAGRGDSAREIAGARNVTLPNQTHVQSATSAEAFVEMYKFFTGRPPATSDIRMEPRGQIELAGRAVIFPQNTGVQSGTLEVWEINPDTGFRMGAAPKAVYPISGDGSWGPFQATIGRSYEMALVREGMFTAHFYPERVVRSDYLLRLNTENQGEGVNAYIVDSEHSSALISVRNKELWGDQGTQNDRLEVNGVNVVNPATCPIDQRVIAVFAYDENVDGLGDVSMPIPFFASLHFFTGVDLVLPATTPPSATIRVELTPRDAGGRTQVVNVPNWASAHDSITVMFNDYLQERLPRGLGRSLPAEATRVPK